MKQQVSIFFLKYIIVITILLSNNKTHSAHNYHKEYTTYHNNDLYDNIENHITSFLSNYIHSPTININNPFLESIEKVSVQYGLNELEKNRMLRMFNIAYAICFIEKNNNLIEDEIAKKRAWRIFETFSMYQCAKKCYINTNNISFPLLKNNTIKELYSIPSSMNSNNYYITFIINFLINSLSQEQLYQLRESDSENVFLTLLFGNPHQLFDLCYEKLTRLESINDYEVLKLIDIPMMLPYITEFEGPDVHKKYYSLWKTYIAFQKLVDLEIYQLVLHYLHT